MLNVHGQQGMSLVEMLVSLVAGLIVVAGAISLFSTVIVSGNTTLLLSRLNQDVQAVTDIIAQDIQRAGHHPSAAAEMASNTSPAVSTKYIFSTVRDVYTEGGTTIPNCIRVKYWDPQPASGAGSVIRVYSYTPNSKQLRVRTTYVEPDSSILGAGECTSDTLLRQLISDSEVSIEHVDFELVSGSNPVGSRSINIKITASSVSKPELSMSLERLVKIRNDGY